MRKKEAAFVDGIVGGERVLIAKPQPEREKNIEIRIRATLAAQGCVVIKHVVDPCWVCGKRPSKQTGLGEGTSDLLIIVPPLGRALWIEVKRPGYSPSDVRPMQRERIALMQRYGAVAGVATSEEEALALLAQVRG